MRVTLAGGIENGVADSNSLNDLSYQLMKEGKYLEGYKKSLLAIDLAKQEKNSKTLARALSNVAANLFYLGQNERALSFYKQSLHIARSLGDAESINRATGNIASLLSEIGQNEEALSYRKSQLALAQASGNLDLILSANVSMSQIYGALGDISLSEQYLKEAKRLWNREKEPFIKIYIQFAEEEIGKLKRDWQGAINSLNISLKIAEKHNYRGLQASIKTNIAEHLLKLRKTDESLVLAEESLRLSIETNNKSKQLQATNLLTSIYENKGEYAQALELTRRAHDLEKSISGEKVLFASELTKIDKNIAETEKALEVSQHREKLAKLKLESHRQLSLFIGTLFLFFVLGAAFWVYRKSTRQQIARQRRLNQELKRLDKVKDRILTNTSHELRTPLNGIVGLSNILLFDEDLSEEARKNISLIEKSGHQLSEIVNDILDLAKFKTYKVTLKPQTFDLVKLVDETIETCRPIKSDNVKITLKHNESTIEIVQDQSRLKQVLFNLIGNALKFTEDGEVRVELTKNNQTVLVSIIDTGIGIPTSMQSRIFEGFEQVNPDDNRKHNGSGLGLAICKEILTAMKSEISLKSELGRGTKISFELMLKSRD